MARTKTIASWSNVLPTRSTLVDGREGWKNAVLQGRGAIPRGAGRSFGDASYLGHGVTCSTLENNAIQPLDLGSATLTVDSGVSLGAVHRFLDPTPFEFPIYGGTQWATVGGAVAGDIHGKNHVAAGSFGHHVEAMEVLTADQVRHRCSPSNHPDLFAATVGGMGLTGMIDTVTLKLQRRSPPGLRRGRRIVDGLGEMLVGFKESGHEFGYCTWFDLMGRNAKGLFCYAGRVEASCRPRVRPFPIPLPRLYLLRPGVVRSVGSMLLSFRGEDEKIVHIRDFNYSGLHELLPAWNRLYGRAGMIEYQFAVRESRFAEVLDELVGRCRRDSQAPIAAVVKRFGEHPPAGLLSFPVAGYTMNFQVPWSRAAVESLRRFTDSLVNLGGRVNLTKDSCVTAEQFERMYEQIAGWRRAVRSYDPLHRVRSDLSNRLQLKPW